MSNLLVMDWDFFFENPMESGSSRDWSTAGLYDWGHAESPFFLSPVLWGTRAAGFLEHDLPLPQITPPTGGWKAFWERFTFAEDASLSFADSNMYAGQMIPANGEPAWSSVVLFDAHHDSGYGLANVMDFVRRGTYSCEDWMIVHHLNGCDDLTVRYPVWKANGVTEPIPAGMPTKQMVDDGAPLDTVFDAVFVCRSGAWVPPWCDRDFLALVDACPLFGEQVDEEELDRGFDLTAARAMAEATRRMIAASRQARTNTPSE